MADSISFDLVVNSKKALDAIKALDKGLGNLNSLATAGSIGNALGGLGGLTGFTGAFLLANSVVNAIPGVNQVGGLLKDAFLANTQGVYAKADAIGNAYERTQNAIGLAGSHISNQDATDIYKIFRDEELRRVQASQDLKEKISPEVLKDLENNAKGTVASILLDIWNLLSGIAPGIETFLQNNNIGSKDITG
jgi:hypothetical protein